MVLAAATLHAAWNTLVKADGDRITAVAALSSTQIVISLCLTPFVAIPEAEGWPYLLAGAVLHTGYMLFLIWAYRYGDLSHVYPLARGVAPFIVAVISVTVVGEELSHESLLAVAVIGLGIMSLALTRGSAGFADLRPVLLALGTGGFLAAYTVVDGLGARLGGTPHGYMVWVTLIDAVLIVACTTAISRGRALLNVGSRWRTGAAAGAISYVAYWLVIWALTLAPFPLVSALRESGIVFAVLFGVLFLKERLNLARLAAISATLIGTVMLKLSR